MSDLEELLKQVRSCRYCAEHLPLGANPVLRVQSSARILIVGQAPGTRVHATGIPWNDQSGERLRVWMDVDRDTFYDQSRIAIMPMGFCYPGKGKSGDLPPRKECVTLWREKLHAHLPNIELTLLIGTYAMQYYLKERMKKTITETIQAFEEYTPQYFPLVHPSPRNKLWLKQNPWFELDFVPLMRGYVHKLL